jgi:hypothetical protein
MENTAALNLRQLLWVRPSDTIRHTPGVEYAQYGDFVYERFKDANERYVYRRAPWSKIAVDVEWLDLDGSIWQEIDETGLTMTEPKKPTEVSDDCASEFLDEYHEQIVRELCPPIRIQTSWLRPPVVPRRKIENLSGPASPTDRPRHLPRCDCTSPRARHTSGGSGAVCGAESRRAIMVRILRSVSNPDPNLQSDVGIIPTCGLSVEFRTRLDKSPCTATKVILVDDKADLDAAMRHFQLPYHPTVAKLERGPRDPAIEVTIKLGDLNLDDKYQVRNGVYPVHLEVLKIAKDLPPIEVFVLPDGALIVTDGRHRHQNALHARQETIRAVLWRGTDLDAELRSLEVNATHGLPLTREEKRRALERYVALRPEDCDAVIAERLSVSNKFVAKIRREISAVAPSAAPTPAIRIDKRGHSRIVTGSHTQPARSKPSISVPLEHERPTPELSKAEPAPAVATPSVSVSAYDQAIELVKSACKLMLGQPAGDIKSFATFTTHKLSELDPNVAQG